MRDNKISSVANVKLKTTWRLMFMNMYESRGFVSFKQYLIMGNYDSDPKRSTADFKYIAKIAP